MAGVSPHGPRFSVWSLSVALSHPLLTVNPQALMGLGRGTGAVGGAWSLQFPSLHGVQLHQLVGSLALETYHSLFCQVIYR